MAVTDDDVFAGPSCLRSAYESCVKDVAVLAFDCVILLIVRIEVEPESALLVACNLALFRDQLGLNRCCSVTPREDDESDDEYNKNLYLFDDCPVHLFPPHFDSSDYIFFEGLDIVF